MPRKLTADNTVKRSSHNVRRTIGANIKARRQTLGWSQQELADQFGVSRPTVSQYEIGTGEVDAGDLPHLAKILGIELIDFYQLPPPVSLQYVEAATVLPSIEEGKEQWSLRHSIRLTRCGIFLTDHSRNTSQILAKAPNFGMDEIADMLVSLYSLSADNRETVRRVMAAMQNSENAEPREPAG